MRFLLHPVKRAVSAASAKTTKNNSKSLLLSASKSSCHQGKVTTTKSSTSVVSSRNSRHDNEQSITNSNNSLTRSWGQQCSSNCGCVVRFETTIDPTTHKFIDAKYVAKSVITTIDKTQDNSSSSSSKLIPMFTTRTNRIMFQECKCQSIHKLATQIINYLPNKTIQQIRNLNDFSFLRSSIAFRHAVLAEHNLPRNHIHCYDIIEEAFSGMVNNIIPTRRRINTEFFQLLRAECLQKPLYVPTLGRKTTVHNNPLQQQQQQHVSNNLHHHNSNNNNIHQLTEEEQQYLQHYIQYGGESRNVEGDNGNDGTNGTLGIDKNKLSISLSPRTMSTLRMFDINAEYWENNIAEENDMMKKGKHKLKQRFGASSSSTNQSSNNNNHSHNRFDWVSYVDEQYENLLLQQHHQDQSA